MEQQEEQEERPTPKRRVLARVAPLVGLNLLATASYGIMATVLPILMTQVGRVLWAHQDDTRPGRHR